MSRSRLTIAAILRVMSQGIPAAVLCALAWGGTQTVSAAVYPTDTVSLQTSYSANVMRRYDLNGNRLASIVSTGIGTTTGGRTVTETNGPNAAIDGQTDLWKLRSSDLTNADSNATGILQITLDQAYQINKFVQLFHGAYAPNDTEIRVSSTGFSGMTTVVPRASIGTNTTATVTNTFNATPVKYIEFQVWGIRSGNSGFAMFSELQAYADSTLNAPLDSLNGYNIIALKAPTIQISEPGSPSPSKWYNGASTLGRIIDLSMNQTSNWIAGAGTGGDAVALIDLGSTYRLTAMTLDFYYSYSFTAGGKIEVSVDNSTFYTVIDRTTSALGAGDYNTTALTEDQKVARYIRLTNHGATLSSNCLLEVEVFGSPVPEPASLSLLTLGGLALLRRRRRKQWTGCLSLGTGRQGSY